MAASRICIVAPEFVGPFPNGGVGTACYWEAVTLAAAGHDVTVLYTGSTEHQTPEYWEGHFAKTAAFRYVDLLRHLPVGAEERAARLTTAGGGIGHEARTAEFVLEWLRGQRFDLVLFQEFLGHAARAVQAQRVGDALEGARTATTMHSCRQWIYEGMQRLPGHASDPVVDHLEKEATRLADHAVAPSQHMADWATTHWRLPERPAVLPYCFDQALAQPATVVDHAGPFEHLVFFGRLETRKGLHLFCRALADNRELSRHVRQVTFLGKRSSVEGQPSDAFIAAHMSRVPDVDWTIKSDMGSLEAQAWLASQRNTLVVAPSIVDNLPYAVIELWTRRIPFVSTRVGGVPEIVGDANPHLLAEPTEASLAEVIGRVCRDGRLRVDYRSGYNVTDANVTHVSFVDRLLALPATTRRPALRRFDVVVANAGAVELDLLRAQMGATDGGLLEGHWIRIEDWRGRGTHPAIMLDARVRPAPGCASRLLHAIRQPGVDVVTSYFSTPGDPATSRISAPLGASLESGWRHNVFGGPCLAAHPSSFPALMAGVGADDFAFWPAYAAAVCRGLSLAIVPAVLYAAPSEAVECRHYAEIESVTREFHAATPSRIDVAWLLKTAIGAQAPASSSSVGRFAYEHLTALPDRVLRAFAGLDRTVADDVLLAGMAQLRARLATVTASWRDTDPRVFIYGTGQHTRLLLTLWPELGRHVAGFIDRSPAETFLGKPCLSPQDFRAELADVIVYSSREYEREMHGRMQQHPVEHVLLYTDSPPAPVQTTATRLRNRFGHAGADLGGLEAIYRPPSWATGFVSGGDAEFLAEMVAAHAPRTVVEIGVASGASSAALLHALDRLPNPESRTLLSCDVRPTCYFNEDYATGQACSEMYPRPQAHWRREFAMDARRLRDVMASGSVDLTFIDANHSHPWPLLDLLHASAIAKPGSWVILHDIDLPVHHPQYQVFGPRWLFAAWPFNKVKGIGQWTSIGAVQMPDDPAALVEMALDLAGRSWEQPPTSLHCLLPAAFDEVQAALVARIAARKPSLLSA